MIMLGKNKVSAYKHGRLQLLCAGLWHKSSYFWIPASCKDSRDGISRSECNMSVPKDLLGCVNE